MTTLHCLEYSNQTILLFIEELSGIHRTHEPVTVGIPFPKGALNEISEFLLLTSEGRAIPLQTQILDRWPDQSLKWVLFDFQAVVAANTTVQYKIYYEEAAASRQKDGDQQNIASFSGSNSNNIILQREANSIIVNTGAATFVVNTTVFKPFEQVLIDGINLLDSSKSRMELLDESGQKYGHTVHNISAETEGPLRTTLKIEGHLRSDQNPTLAEFFAQLHFYANSPVSRIDYTIRNPKAAKHPGGLWDLGDEGSIYFEDLSLHLAMISDGATTVEWTTQPERPLTKSDVGKIEIYQDSSGGENWNSVNHVNRFGKVMHSFCGYRVTSDTILEEGKRSNPVVMIRDKQKQITAAVRGFWQNFPKSIEANENSLTIRLFPVQYQDLFELQGGEQKTHTFFLSFEPSDLEKTSEPSQGFLNWIDNPLIPHAQSEWYIQANVFHYVTLDDPHPEIRSLINTAIEGDNTFFDRREVIDEYGWRNFGDLYADHEKVFYKGDGDPVSHYNNQYDCVYGMLIQYVRSGNIKWFTLLDDLAHHVIDIDIYHTNQDKPNFSGGFLWHTDHYRDAGMATHRGFSKMTMINEGLSYYGGGPGSEHNYATGLMYHYYLTGESASKDVVIGLADWVINMDDGAKTKFRFLNCRPTGHASTSDTPEYHGPGRGAGYSINALLDAYLLTKEKKYLAKLDELIQRCIHPKDNIEEHDLTNTEDRWFYIVFLQVIGRYLDFKVEKNELDYMYCYARESLLHYAKWMRDHEVPYSTLFDILEYPTETWPAQDIRKSNVFKFAAKYSQEPLRSEFLQKSASFFEQALQDLFSFETKILTRPLILLMTNSMMHSYWQKHPDEMAPNVECHYDFGQPQKFKPQLYYVFKIRAGLFNMLRTIKRIFGR